MRSRTPKGLHPVCGKPIVAHILDALTEAGVGRRVVVIGHQAETFRSALNGRYGPNALRYAEQTEQKGTGHAALMAQSALTDHTGTVLIVPGDAPLLTADILRRLIEVHYERNAAATLLTAVLPVDAGSYGRVVRDVTGEVSGIVEARDANKEQLKIREINTSVYAFSAPELFRCLIDLQPTNAQGELYLTDVISMLHRAHKTIASVVSEDPDVVLGVNTRVELAEVGAKMRARLLHDLMLSGVTIEDPATTYVEADVTVGQDTTILPNTHLMAGTVIGEECVLGPNTQIANSRIGNGVLVKASFVDSAQIGDDVRIGPFANIRPGTKLDNRARVGNFVETKAAHLHEQVSALHLSYIGDAEIGARTNIGAGTITCNYDGVNKSRTVVGSDVFIGSHSTLVAPAQVGDGAGTAAGSVITEPVPEGALAFGRARQVIKEGRETERRNRLRAAAQSAKNR